MLRRQRLSRATGPTLLKSQSAVGRTRRLVVAGLAAFALVVIVFPPWRARAIRTTTRYAAVPGVAPSVVNDTLVWTLAFAPVYAPPRSTLDGQRMKLLAARSLSGDTTAAGELRRLTEDVERRYHAPEVLRAAGAIWRDSVLARAGIPSVTSYDLTFVIDESWMAARLAVLATVVFVLLLRKKSRPESFSVTSR